MRHDLTRLNSGESDVRSRGRWGSVQPLVFLLSALEEASQFAASIDPHLVEFVGSEGTGRVIRGRAFVRVVPNGRMHSCLHQLLCGAVVER